ncbi:MAG: hypothetical protein Q9199_004503 [Rusavskia elegans]
MKHRAAIEDAIAYPDLYKKAAIGDAIAYPDSYKQDATNDPIAYPDSYKRTAGEEAVAYPASYKRDAKADAAVAYPDSYKRDAREEAVAYPDAYKREAKEDVISLYHNSTIVSLNRIIFAACLSGLDTVIQALRSFQSNKRNASLEQQFTTYAPLRLFTFGPFIGKGIMTADGTFWTHSRALLKPTFSRQQISDFSAYRVHVDHVLTALAKHDGSDVDLDPYFKRLALYSSTEFLFGHSTGSLTASANLGRAGFPPSLQLRPSWYRKAVQLPQWNFLKQDKRFWSSCKLARAFVERCVEQASASLRDAATKEPSRLILAHQLAAAQTSDHKDIVNQLLNVFLPAHDATAVALTNIFFHLSRHIFKQC